MKDHDGRLPEDLSDIAARLTAAREQPSELELDELRRRVRGRVTRSRRAPRRGLAGALRTNGVAAALTIGLVLSSGVGVVLACGSLGVKKPPVVTIASKGGHDPGHKSPPPPPHKPSPPPPPHKSSPPPPPPPPPPPVYGGVWQGTSFHGHRSASFCQYHGPQTYTYTFHTSHGTVIVILTWDCFHLHFHFQFIPAPIRGYRWGGFNYRWGGGPSYNCNQSSYDTTAPDGTNELSFSTDGSSFNIPIAW